MTGTPGSIAARLVQLAVALTKEEEEEEEEEEEVLTERTSEAAAPAPPSSRNTLTVAAAEGSFAVTVHGFCNDGVSHVARPVTIPVDSLIAVTAPPTARKKQNAKRGRERRNGWSQSLDGQIKKMCVFVFGVEW